MFHTEKEQNPRIEWKKKGKDVSFVYFDGHFRGENTSGCQQGLAGRLPQALCSWTGMMNKLLVSGVKT